jgi:hypothetical protein
VALLRVSSSALGDELDVPTALTSGAGVPGGRLLLDFAEAAHVGSAELPDRRNAVEAEFGEGGLVEACLTVAAFNGLTRVADATGILLDGGSLAATTDLRAALGLNDFPGARSTGPAIHRTGRPLAPSAIGELFRD